MFLSVFFHIIIGIVVAATVLGFSPAAAQGPTVGLGTNPPGSLFYTVGGGLAKVVTEAGAAKMAVQPYSGTSTFIPILNTGELEFGVVNAVDMGLAYRGPDFKIGGRNPFPHTPDARLVMRGAPLRVALMVRKDSPIKTIHDIRGKRMTGEYPAHLAVWYNMFGHLASAGMTWKDVKVVPVPAVNQGVDALIQRRADVTEHAVNSAKMKEAHAKVGIRLISDDCSPEGKARIKQAVRGYYTVIVKKGKAPGAVEDTCVIAYDIYLVAAAKTPEPLVAAVLKALWEGTEKLKPVHPIFRAWTQKRAVTAEATIPYHPGAVRFYKEHGAWTGKMETAQRRLLALNP